MKNGVQPWGSWLAQNDRTESAGRHGQGRARRAGGAEQAGLTRGIALDDVLVSSFHMVALCTKTSERKQLDKREIRPPAALHQAPANQLQAQPNAPTVQALVPS